jgi:hypothetical protein
MELNKEALQKIYNQITMKTAPVLIIIFLTFLITFSGTKLTIMAATDMSYFLLVGMLILNQIICLFFLKTHNQNQNQNQYKIYIILMSILMTFALIYIIYIKRIYDKEKQIITKLNEQDILKDTNVTC